jgi:hypothetical protein
MMGRNHFVRMLQLNAVALKIRAACSSTMSGKKTYYPTWWRNTKDYHWSDKILTLIKHNSFIPCGMTVTNIMSIVMATVIPI